MSPVSSRLESRLAALLLGTALVSCPAAFASEIDSEHLFGFTEGADIGGPGEMELEFEGTGRIGKRAGRFRAFDGGFALKVPLATWFRVAPGLSFSRYHIDNVPGLTDHKEGHFNGAFLETRVRLLDRRTDPFGLTVNAVPSVSRIESVNGHRAETYGVDFGILADRELIPGRLIGAVNFGYGFGTSCLRGSRAWQRGSGFELSGALAYQAFPELMPGVFLGAEARYVRSFDGLGLDRLGGEAVYLGPTVYATLPGHTWVSATWGVQAAGQAVGVPGALDLTRFDRHQLRLRIGYHF